jgi:hypothetical protein
MLYGISVRILVRRQNKSQAKCFSAMAAWPSRPPARDAGVSGLRPAKLAAARTISPCAAARYRYSIWI